MKKILTSIALGIFTLGLTQTIDGVTKGQTNGKSVYGKSHKKYKKAKKHKLRAKKMKKSTTKRYRKVASNNRTFQYKPVTQTVDDLTMTYTYFKDKNAEFIGGQEAFLKFYRDNVMTANSYTDNNQTTVSFIVDQNGQVSNVEAKGTNAEINNATIAAIYKSSGMWKPAEINGNPVKAIHTLPLSIKYVDNYNDISSLATAE